MPSPRTLVKRTIVTETFEDPEDLDLEDDLDDEDEDEDDEEEAKPAARRTSKK
jgi:hypothetical protein